MVSLSCTLQSKRYVVLGLGREERDDDDKDKDKKKKEKKGLGAKIGAVIASKCHSAKKAETCTVLLPTGVLEDDLGGDLRDVSSSFYSSLYSDDRYRTGDKKKVMAEDLSSVNLILEGPQNDKEEDPMKKAIEDGKSLAAGVYLTRDIVNAPHNVLNSESLAETAQRIADESKGGTVTCKILNKEECEQRGMGAYLGVARGSETDPRFIHLTYTPPSDSDGDEEKKNMRVGVVGKGLLFDTGGYNIKTSSMELMKFDCGGAAATLGAARAVSALQPAGVEIHFIVAACENMINDKAMVASDVLTASNGKTIEVINTDAEGRLTLADALVYADEEVGCESIVELSTLTGACMVSLGKSIAGVWTSSDELADELRVASEETGEKVWRMPLEGEYNDQIKSKIADMTNCGTAYGGAITAALFLENFVSKKRRFAHVDIAGPVWSDKSGATGFGCKLVTEWVTSQGATEADSKNREE